MKYIRTKDKIEKVPNDYANKLIECPDLKIGESIEELCDEFVVINNNGKYEGLTDKLDFAFINFFQSFKDKTIKCYGAIWTDKGLIYVAKMNEEGELELL